MSYRPRKRARSVVVAPSAGVPVPRPMMIYKAARPMRRRIMTVQRQLSKVTSIYVKRVAATGLVHYSYGTPDEAYSSSSSAQLVDHGIKHADQTLCWAFLLRAFNQATDLSSAFDQYRLKSVSVTFIPSFSVAEQNVAQTGISIPTFYFAEDKDEITTGTGYSDIATISSKQGSKFARMDQPFTVRLKPNAWTSAANAETVKTKVLGGWLPCTQNYVPHYGLKVRPIEATLAGDIEYKFTVVVKGSFECKHMS